MQADSAARGAPITVAVGVLSAFCQYGSFAAGVWIPTAELRKRRDRLRETAAALAPRQLVLTFLMESPEAAKLPYMWRCKPKGAERAVREEAARTGDIMFLSNYSRDYFGCGWKYALWFKEAIRRYPSVKYIAAADDDTYIHFGHLLDELGTLHREHKGERLYWGMMLWRSHYNPVTLEPSANWEGWHFTDKAAVRTRRKLEACFHEQQHPPSNAHPPSNTHPPSDTLGGRRLAAPSMLARRDGRSRLMRSGCDSLGAPELIDEAQAGQIDSSTPPFPVANGPLFAISAELASDVASDPLPLMWREGFRASNPYCIHAYVHTCIRAYVHTCIHAYMHTCIHAYRKASAPLIHPTSRPCSTSGAPRGSTLASAAVLQRAAGLVYHSLPCIHTYMHA